MTTRTSTRMRHVLALALLSAGAACGADNAGGAEPAGSEDAGSADPARGEDAGGGAAGHSGSGGLTFEADIHPLFVGSCGNCHGAGSEGPPRPGGPGEGGGSAPGKFAVDDAAASYAAAMPYVVVGDAAKSALYIKISQDMPSTGGTRMPPALRQWDDASIALLRDWIDQGAVER